MTLCHVAVRCEWPGFRNGSTCIVGAGSCSLHTQGFRTCFRDAGSNELSFLGGSAPAIIGRATPSTACPFTRCPSGNTALVQIRVGSDLSPFFTSGIPTAAKGRVSSAQACRDRAARLQCGTKSPGGFFVFIPQTGTHTPWIHNSTTEASCFLTCSLYRGFEPWTLALCSSLGLTP